MPDTDTFAMRKSALPEILAPDVPYLPPAPRAYRPRIALVGAGGIAASHLDAYRTAGWDVAAICNRSIGRAEARAAEYFPDALVTDNFDTFLAEQTLDVIDITPHPADRIPLIRRALEAGRHVLSQKPFVTDLDEGAALVAIARARGVKLAVNQNGRWAPHLAWMRGAVRAGLIGEVTGVVAQMHWDHNWVAGAEYDKISDLIHFDFGIHWYDFLTSLVGARIESVQAMAVRVRGQTAVQPLAGQALVAFDGGQAALVFDGAARHGPRDTTQITGTHGSLSSEGPNLGDQRVTLTTAAGVARPLLTGTWFNDGFRGAMGALLVAIEDDMEPENGAAENLSSLALSFAAARARQTGERVAVGSVRRL